MNDQIQLGIPSEWSLLEEKCKAIGFTMPSDLYIGSFLKTLIASKPQGHFLELGTGIGLSLCWMIQGMDEKSKLVSIDNDPQLCEIVQEVFQENAKVEIVCEDGGAWMKNYKGPKFDLIFADAWPGKYFDLEIALDLLNVGGFYVIDDMSPADDWPEGHAEKADNLIQTLESHPNFTLTKFNWSTGVMLATKINS